MTLNKASCELVAYAGTRRPSVCPSSTLLTTSLKLLRDLFHISHTSYIAWKHEQLCSFIRIVLVPMTTFSLN